jgi:Pectate lyase superfamily protein
MSVDFTRRSLARGIGRTGLGLGAISLLPQATLADTPFSSFAFPATGAPTTRTMPDRLAEIRNVVDFGADPTGSKDSRAAIQAAVDAVAGANRGIIYFPLGFYNISSPITFNYSGNLSICFRGHSGGSTVAGNFNGYLFNRQLGTPNNTAIVSFEKLNLQNGNPSSGAGAVRIGSTRQAVFRDMQMVGFTCLTTEDSPGNSSQNIFLENCKLQTATNTTGTTGLVIGGGGAMVGCDFVGSDFGVKAYGNGLQMAGNRIENCNTAYQLGYDSAGNNVGMSGFALVSSSIEGNITGIDLIGTCTGGYIGQVGILGHPGSGPTESSPTLYGLRIRAGCAQSCVFSGIVVQSYHDIASIAIANASRRANNVFLACSAYTTGGGVAWTLPTNAYTAQFIKCNTQPVWTFSQLPSGGDVLEGDEYSISDSSSATWGSTVAGSGSNHVSTRYNGTNWTVVGK